MYVSQSYRQSVGLLEQEISPWQGRYQHRATETQNRHRRVNIPREEFETTTPLFGHTKAFHALDRAATVAKTKIYTIDLSIHSLTNSISIHLRGY
jgi:hypothetical protein